MESVIPCPMSNISLIPGTAFLVKKNCLTKCSTTKKLTKFSAGLVLTPSNCLLFSPYCRESTMRRTSGVHLISATGTNVAVEEPDSPIVDENSSGSSVRPAEAVETSENPFNRSDANPTPAQARRSRPGRKSEMPPVKNEELVAGATFTGKVRSIQPFGAFVDFGAFTDGLVHVSNLSNSFVKDVGSFVSVGQEVKVKILEVNSENGRISLTMREIDDSNNLQQQKDVSSISEKTKAARKNAPKSSQKKNEVKSSKFVKGQELQGTVKNLTRAGSFISLPDNEEGFLPTSEESNDEFSTMMGGSSLQVGQEVSVRVLRVTRGQVTLTMKTEDVQSDPQLSQGVVHVATNPFVLAFRQNKDIAAFLDERERFEKADKQQVKPASSQKLEGRLDGSDVPLAVDEKVEDDETSSKKSDSEAIVDSDNRDKEFAVSDAQIRDSAANVVEEESEIGGMLSTKHQLIENDSLINEIGGDGQSEASNVVATWNLNLESPVDEVVGDQGNNGAANDEVQIQALTTDSDISSSAPVGRMEPIPDENGSPTVSENQKSDEKSGPSGESLEDQIISSESQVIQELVEDEDKNTSNAMPIQTPAAEVQIPSGLVVDDAIDGHVLEDNGNVGDSNRQSGVPFPKESVTNDNLRSEKSGPSGDSLEDQIISSESQVIQELVEDEDQSSSDVMSIQTPVAEVQIPSGSVVGDAVDGHVLEEKGSVGDINGQSGVPSPKESITKDDLKCDEKSGSSADSLEYQTISSKSQVVQELVENKDKNTSEAMPIKTPAAEIQIPSGSVVDKAIDGHVEENGNVGDSNRPSGVPSPKESVIKASISPALVKQLREETGAGMMDCKKALAETGGDIVKAQEFLRKKGLASADKKSSRATAEGRIGSYIHDSRIGVLVEVNCETDFVSRGDIFGELVDDLAMQVAACPQVQYLVTEDVPEEIVDRERKIEIQKEDLLSKPEQIRSKIVEGRIRKRLEELALLEQPFIKNDKVVVKDWVKQTIATIGENIKVKRFVRYNLGEGLEKKSQDFAAEVAAQTAAKPVPTPDKVQPATVEEEKTVEKAPAATISAALVKQLREETGAGMMDCKKALSETGGDLEKAQVYLRKKGLSTADKKSSRLAAEGRIGSYIHDSRIGVLIEVNCETDFVGRSEKFKELVDDLAMQVVACPQVQYVSIEDIPENIVKKEKELEMQREDLLSKPENIREKIVEGRVSKRLGELALLEQPFIKNDGILVKDLVKQTVASLGENMRVRRFVRFTLGETAENAGVDAEA